MGDLEAAAHAQGYEVITPVLPDGTRTGMMVRPDDAAKVTRGPGLKGEVIDRVTMRRWRVYGAPCGLEECYCDARVEPAEGDEFMSGFDEGVADAQTWISEQHPDLDDLRACGAPGTLLPDETLINALGDEALADLIGAAVRDADGEWTPQARAWLREYNRGHRECVEEEIRARLRDAEGGES